MTAPAASALERAAALSDTGRRGDAARLLYAELHEFNPLDDTVDEYRAQLAAAYVHAARHDVGVHQALMQWARYAYRSYRSVHGPDQDTTLVIGTGYVEVLILRGCLREAAIVAEQVADGFADRYGPHDPRTLLFSAARTMILLRIDRLGEPRVARAWRACRPHPAHDVGVTVRLLRACSVAATCPPHSAAEPSTARSAGGAPTRHPGLAGRDRR